MVQGALVLVWKFFHIPGLLSLLTTYDPGAFWFAERTTALLFDQRRFAPAPGEPLVFELALVVGFGIECLLIGMAVTWLLRRRAGRLESPATAR